MTDFSHLGIDCFYLAIVPTGSRFNCDPPVFNTDQDYLIHTLSSIDNDLIAAGYIRSIDVQLHQPASVPKKGGKPDETFMSWRKDDINLIVTSSSEFFMKHKISGFICKKLNILDKADRIMVYHAIMYGEYDGAEPQFNTQKPEIDYFEINRIFANT